MKVSVRQSPQRIVACVGAAPALWDFGVRPVGVFGPTKTATGEKDRQAGNLDLATVQSVGNVWGEFNLEEYARLRPDLLVSVLMGGQTDLVEELAAGVGEGETDLTVALGLRAWRNASLGGRVGRSVWSGSAPGNSGPTGARSARPTRWRR